MEAEHIISLIKTYLKERQQYEQAKQISRELNEKFRRVPNCRETVYPPKASYLDCRQQLERMVEEADENCKRKIGQWYRLHHEVQEDDDLALLLEKHDIPVSSLSFWEKWAITISRWFK